MSGNNELFILKDRSGVPENADYSVKVSETMAEPYIKDGGAVFVSANTDLDNGDIGIFLYSGKMVIRQYCEDSLGNMYLFTLNRKMRDHDITVPHDFAEKIVCFGKVILKDRIPLPEI